MEVIDSPRLTPYQAALDDFRTGSVPECERTSPCAALDAFDAEALEITEIRIDRPVLDATMYHDRMVFHAPPETDP